MTAQLTRALSANLTASYVYNEFKSVKPSVGYEVGERVPGAPEENASAGLQYNFALNPAWSGYARADHAHNNTASEPHAVHSAARSERGTTRVGAGEPSGAPNARRISFALTPNAASHASATPKRSPGWRLSASVCATSSQSCMPGVPGAPASDSIA